MPLFLPSLIAISLVVVIFVTVPIIIEVFNERREDEERQKEKPFISYSTYKPSTSNSSTNESIRKRKPFNNDKDNGQELDLFKLDNNNGEVSHNTNLNQSTISTESSILQTARSRSVSSSSTTSLLSSNWDVIERRNSFDDWTLTSDKSESGDEMARI